jgi:hypothetical protein
MTINLRFHHIVSVVLCLSVTAALPLSGTASASHPRPKGATPQYESLVIAYKQCTSPNRMHTSPLALPSCNPPIQVSPWLTACEITSNGCPANFNGFARLDACVTSAGACAPMVPPADIVIRFSLADVRCTPALVSAGGPCGTQSPLGMYGGSLDAIWDVRITDHCNAPSTPPTTCAASTGTMVDTGWPIPLHAIVPCSSTIVPPPPNCVLTTTGNTLNPGMFTSTSRSNIEADVRINDGGADGNPLTSGPPPDVPSTTYAQDGVFFP